MVWGSYGQDSPASWGVFGQRFGPTGAPLGGEFQVNGYTPGTQWRPAVAADDLGNFVVVWAGAAQDGSDYGIFGQRFSSGGIPAGGEFQVNSYTTGMQYAPAVAADGAGSFTVVWSSFEQDGADTGVFGQRFDALGAAVGDEFQVNSYTTSRQRSAGVAAIDGGGFVVVWESYDLGASTYDVIGQRFDAAGDPAGSAFMVNSYTTGYQFDPAVAVDGTGKFLVVWSSGDQDGSGYGVFGQRYDASGTPAGGEFQANQYTTQGQERPAVAMDDSGSFLVTWDSFQDPLSNAVLGRRFTAAGLPAGSEFLVNTYTPYSQTHTAAAADSAGNFVVIWDSSLQDGSDYGVFGKRLTTLLFADGFGTADACAWSATVGGGCP